MGIYIEGIEKPKKCDDCPFCGYDERQSILFCRVDNEDIEQDLRDDCPLIEIDDELFKKAESAYVLQQIRRR